VSAPPPPVEACCALLYGDPLVELLAGESLHPGGLATSRRLLAAAGLTPGQRILDAGCGLGASARLAAFEFKLRVDACDVSGEAIRRARALAESAGAPIRFTAASVLELPFADASFAGVLVECVLSTTTKAAALREIRRVLGRGGKLLVSDVVSNGPTDVPEPLASVLCLSQAWRPGELEDEVASAGFVVERSLDETAGVSDLLDRLEARAGLLRAVRRDVGSASWPSSALGGLVGQLGDAASLTDLMTEIRRLVRDGQIGYRALAARAI
jgi:SAM-dependent methyltransferase